MKKLVKVGVVLLAVFFLFGTVVVPAFAESIKVGILLPLTGKLAKFGEIENKSFLMAVEEINAAGGVNGKKIELIIEDTTGKPDVGRSAIEKLISRDKVVIVGGGYSSSVTWASVAVAQQRKIPFLVNTGSADKITEQGWNYIFRLNPPVSEYPKGFASFLKAIATDVKTVAILHENSLFGQSGSKKFVKQCEKIGLKVLMKEGYEAGAIDFKPLLVKVKAKKPDLVYMISYIMDAALLIRQSEELRIEPKLFVGGAAGFTLPEFQKNVGKGANFVYSATLWTPSVPYPGAREYYDNFVKKYNTPTEYHGAEAYAAMYVIADALKRAKSLTHDAVRDALAKTDMMTAFGPVKFVSYGKKINQNSLPTFLVQWLNGKLETVWPKEVATAKYVYPAPKWNER
ncbi:MAG: ABC transporter substrate-binding protein [Deltaproteobacteria bacterium]|nr:ABC transporter substrate-binding protein [Deltaproteobacteria bacterium]MBW1942829.1 ABC transporter substrate-binding protein [Deltaproteobacteria bacterium]